MAYGYMDKLIEEYREELREKQNAELKARLKRNRSTEELFAALLSLAPKREAAMEEKPVLA